MGFECISFCSREKLNTASPENVVVGYANAVQEHLFDVGIMTPERDYPAELKKYLGRKIWKTRIDYVNSSPELWPVFVKPIEDKKFTGRVIYSPKELICCGRCGENAEVYCSEVVPFTAEWQYFARYGKIQDVRPYRGDWRLHFDPAVIENAIQEYTSAPNGYADDFSLTSDGRTLSMEINDE